MWSDSLDSKFDTRVLRSDWRSAIVVFRNRWSDGNLLPTGVEKSGVFSSSRSHQVDWTLPAVGWVADRGQIMSRGHLYL